MKKGTKLIVSLVVLFMAVLIPHGKVDAANTKEDAYVVETNKVYSSTIYADASEEQWYKFYSDKTQRIKFTTVGSQRGIIFMSLYDPSGEQINYKSEVTGPSTTETLSCVVKKGTYYLRIVMAWGIIQQKTIICRLKFLMFPYI